MIKPVQRSWFKSLVGRRRHQTPIQRAKARLSVERFETRDCPSNSIPLNFFNTTPDWTAVGPAPILHGGTPGSLSTNGRVSGVAVDPTNPNRIFVTGASGGVWRTLDGGVSWTPLTLHIPGIADNQRTLNMGGIAISASNPNIIYAAEGEGDGDSSTGFGVLKSTDGGDTWALTGASVFTPLASHSIVVDNLDPNIVFVNAKSYVGYGIPDPRKGGVFRSLDGGATWVNITTGAGSSVFGGGTAFVDVDLQPRNTLADPVVLYTTLGFGGGDLFNGIYRTINATAAPATVSWNLLIGGSTLVPGTGPGNIQISLSRTLPSTIYASIGDSNGGFLGVYKTSDSGVNWLRVLAPPPNFFNTQGDYDNVITVSPTNPLEAIVGGATNSPFRTTNGGQSWTNITNVNGTGPHADLHAAVYDSNGNYLLGSDGGLFRFNITSNPQNWQSMNGFNSSSPNLSALNIVQFTSVTLHPRDANLALGGSQDNGTERFNDNVGWNQTNGGDGGKIIYNYDNPLHLVQTHPIPSFGVAGFMQYSDDGGLTWTAATTPPNATTNNTNFYPPLLIDPSNSNRWYFGSDQLSISEDGGVTWGTRYTFPQGAQNIPGDPLTGLNPPDPISAIGVGRASGGFALFYVAHDDGTLLQLFVAPPPNPAPATTDWADITPLGGALGTITEIQVDPQNPANIYVVGAGGVARSKDFGGTWTLLNGSGGTGLPGFFSAATIQLDPKNFTDPTDDVLYVGGSYGVFKLNNPGGASFTWSRVGGTYDPVTKRGLPDVDVSQLVLNTTTGILAAGTYGAGMWEIQVRGLIRGQKFEDLNGNGVKDLGEPGVPNIFVRLLNNDNPNAPFEIANTITDANGFFEFRSLTSSQLTAVNYLLVEITPSGSLQSTTPLTFQNLTEQSTFDIGDPTLDPSRVEIGNFRTDSISGTKFEDRNANGIKDPGEPGLQGFTIFIDSNNNGTLDAGEASTVTDSSGNYTFTGLGPAILNGVTNPATFNGVYLIREVQQVGFQQTSPNPSPITLVSGQNVSNINIGNIRVARITGGKFEDVNGNGVRDAGDGPLSGFVFDLQDGNGNFLRSVTSDLNGNWSFLSLPAGTYRVVEEPAVGYTQTTPNPAPFVLTSTSQLDNAYQFGNFKNFTVSGFKFNDLNGNGVQDSGEPGLQGFTFQLTNSVTGATLSTAVSDAFGNFAFPNLGPLTGGAQYRVREVVPGGWSQSTISPPDLPALSGHNATVTFGNFRKISVSGTVYNDLNSNGARDPGEPGIPGFTLQLKQGATIVASAISAADGTYSLPSVGAGTYTLIEKPRRGFVITGPAGGSYTINAVSSTNITGEDFGNSRRQITVTSDDSGGPPTVTIRDASTNAVKSMFSAYAPAFTGGVRTAIGYVNNDTIPDIITGAGPGGGPHVRVFDGATGNVLFEFMAYETTFTGGVYVAAGDVDGDGRDDVIVGAGVGGGPFVKVFSGVDGHLIKSFFAYDQKFRGGVTVAAGDWNADGIADIATGAGPGGGPHAEVFNGGNLSILFSTFPYDVSFTGGVYVALGDINGDGHADLITGPGVGGGPHVKVYNGANGVQLYSFLAYTGAGTTNWASGLHVGSYDVNLDGLADIIVAPGRGQRPRVRVLDGGTLTPIFDFTATDLNFLGGIYVAGN